MIATSVASLSNFLYYGTTYPECEIIADCKRAIDNNSFDTVSALFKRHQAVLVRECMMLRYAAETFNHTMVLAIRQIQHLSSDYSIIEVAVDIDCVALVDIIVSTFESAHYLNACYLKQILFRAAVFYKKSILKHCLSNYAVHLSRRDLQKIFDYLIEHSADCDMLVLMLKTFSDDSLSARSATCYFNETVCFFRCKSIDVARLALCGVVSSYGICKCGFCGCGFLHGRPDNRKCRQVATCLFAATDNWRFICGDIFTPCCHVACVKQMCTYDDISESQILEERRKIRNAAYILIKREAIEMSLAFREFPALITTYIIDQLPFAHLVPFHCKWNVVTFAKHFQQ